MTGIDLIIANINSYLAEQLWLNSNVEYNGRVFENVKDKGIVPEILDGNNYVEVLHNIKKDGQMFWRVLPDNKRTGEPLRTSLFIYLNLKKLYPTTELWEAREVAVRDILNVMDYTQFNYENTIIGKDSFSMWTGANQNKHDMNEFFMLRIDGDIAVNCYTSSFIAPETVEITLQAEAGGTTLPAPAVLNLAYKSNNAFFAKADMGSVFRRWLLDGVERLTNPISLIAIQATTLIAVFVQGLILTITKTGYGTINPEVGEYSKVEGDEQILTATPLDTGFGKTDSYFESFDINGDIITDNPHTLVMPNAPVAVATTFKLWNNDVVVFNNVPVSRGGTYFFENTGSGQDADINNVRVGTFSTTSYIATGLQLVGQTAIDYTCIFNFTVTNTIHVLLSAGAGTTISKGLFLQVNSSTNLLSITISNGSTRQVTTITPLSVNTFYNINFTWDGFIGGTFNVTINGVLFSFVATHEWTGNAATTLNIGGSTTNGLNGTLIYANLIEKCQYVFNHGQGSVIHNLLGGVNGTVTGANLATFWGSTANGVEAYDLTKGATLYQNNSDGTIMPICFNTSQVISGFTRLGWFPPNSGILKGLPNTYNINGVDRNFDYLKALPTSETLIKTETDNTISYYKERSKDV